MKRVLDAAIGNPIAARELTSGLGAFKLAAAFLVLEGALLVSDLAIFVFLAEEARALSAGTPALLLHMVHTLVLFVALVTLLPLRVSGWLEGPRFSRTLDQIVVTGVSPVALLAGNWLVALLYAALLLAVSLPHQLVAWSFGGLELSTIFTTYGILLLWSNLVIASTLALSVLEREWLTALLVPAVFGFVGLLSIIPEPEFFLLFPSVFAELTPLRWLLRECGIDARLASALDLPREFPLVHAVQPRFLFFRIPASVFPVALWTLLAGIACVYMAIGPEHRFTPGLDGFGSVVLPRDRRRRLLSRLRFVLTRRVEVAFFYENCPTGPRRLDFLLRFACDATLLFLLQGSLIGTFYGDDPQIRVYGRRFLATEDPFFLLSLFFGAASVALWICARIDTRNRVDWLHGIGPVRFPRTLARLGALIALIGAFFVVQHEAFSRSVDSLRAASAGLAPIPSDSGVVPDPWQRVTRAGREPATEPELQAYSASWWRIMTQTALILVHLYLIGQTVAWWSRNGVFVRGVWLFLAILLTILSVSVHAGISNRVLLPALAPLAGLTPSILALEGLDELDWSGDSRLAISLAGHGFAFALWGGAILLSHILWLVRRRRAVRAAGPVAKTAAALLLVALPLLAPDAARGQEAPPASEEAPSTRPQLPLEIVEVVRGFGGSLFFGAGDFITLVLRNPTPDDVEGELWLETRDPSPLGQRSEGLHFAVPGGTTTVVRWRRELREGSDPLIELPARLVLRGATGELVTVVDPPSLLPGDWDTRTWQRQRSSPAEPRRTWVVVSDEPVDSANATRRLGGSDTQAVATALPLWLPENVSDWLGVDTVLIRARELSTMSPAQKTALRDFVRLGGSLVFAGELDPRELQGSGLFDAALAAATVREIRALGQTFRLLELSPPSAPASGTDDPITSFQSVGLGRLGHLAVDPITPPRGVPTGTLAARVHAECEVGLFPVLALGSSWGYENPDLRDLSSLLATLAMLGGYALLLPAVLVVGFRDRRRRLAMWVAVVVISSGAAIGIPSMTRLLQRGASFAEHREIEYRGPRPGTGVVLDQLTISSCGRTEHVIGIRRGAAAPFEVGSGATGRSWRWYWGEQPRVDVLRPLPFDEESGTSTLVVAPWGRAQLQIVSDASTRRPGAGLARYTPRTREVTLDLDTSDLPEGTWDARIIGLRLPDQSDVVWTSSSLSTVEGRAKLSLLLSREKGNGHGLPVSEGYQDPVWRWDTRASLDLADGLALSLSPLASRRILVVISLPGLPSTGDEALTSEHLAFEREISAELAERRLTQANPRPRVVERDGQWLRLFRHRLLVLEPRVTIVD